MSPNWQDMQEMFKTASPSLLLETFEKNLERYERYRTWQHLAATILVWRELRDWIDAMADCDRIFYNGELECELPENWDGYVRSAEQSQLLIKFKLGAEEFIPWIEYHSELDDDIPF